MGEDFLWGLLLLLLVPLEYVVEQVVRVMWQLSQPIPEDTPD